jgi:hypothetical protein
LTSIEIITNYETLVHHVSEIINIYTPLVREAIKQFSFGKKKEFIPAKILSAKAFGWSRKILSDNESAYIDNVYKCRYGIGAEYKDINGITFSVDIPKEWPDVSPQLLPSLIKTHIDNIISEYEEKYQQDFDAYTTRENNDEVKKSKKEAREKSTLLYLIKKYGIPPENLK